MEMENNSVAEEMFVEEQYLIGEDDGIVYERNQNAEIITSSESDDNVPFQSNEQPDTPNIDKMAKEELHEQVSEKTDDIQKEADSITISDECESSDIIDLDVPALETQEYDLTLKSEEFSDFNPSEKLTKEQENANEQEVTSGKEQPSIEPEFPILSEEETLLDSLIHSSKRSVPFRRPRKFFARITGIHGAFAKPSSKTKMPKR